MTQPAVNNHPLPQTPTRDEEESTRWGHGVAHSASPTDSLQHTPPQPSVSVKRKAVPRLDSTDSQPEIQLQHAPLSPVNISPPRIVREADTASIRQAPPGGYFNDSRRSSGQLPESPSIQINDEAHFSNGNANGKKPASTHSRRSGERPHSRASSGSYPTIDEEEDYQDVPESQGLQYHGFDDAPKKKKTANKVSHVSSHSMGSSSSGGGGQGQLGVPKANGGLVRPMSMMTLGSELRGRTGSPLNSNGSDPGSPRNYAREVSGSRRSPAVRPVSYVENLNNVPYSQQIAPGAGLRNEGMQHIVGSAASRMDTKKTLEMYRANVKKTNDAAVQYEFAIFMLNAAKEVTPADDINPAQLVLEAKQILSKLADRAYPFAQYYLGDGYTSGLFNKDKPDQGKAFELFVAASKHGHAEAGYRVGLCYEFGWGTAVAYPKAVQFYRASASKNHPGAATRLGMACITGGMGLFGKDKAREGIKWLKRAAESADMQYNAGPYELGKLHLDGFADDVFKDEAYASQLFTQSAELGHVQASYIMGQAYENGWYGCPRDAALSVHFYNGAAVRGHPEAMMALCAWYMVGAEPVLEKDEGEAYAWAKQAAETGESPFTLTSHVPRH